MTQPELSSWKAFYRLYPFDDLNRFHKPAALVAATQGINPDDALQWLQPDQTLSKYSKADMSVLKTLGVDPRKAQA